MNDVIYAHRITPYHILYLHQSCLSLREQELGTQPYSPSGQGIFAIKEVTVSWVIVSYNRLLLTLIHQIRLRVNRTLPIVVLEPGVVGVIVPQFNILGVLIHQIELLRNRAVSIVILELRGVRVGAHKLGVLQPDPALPCKKNRRPDHPFRLGFYRIDLLITALEGIFYKVSLRGSLL